MYTVMIFGSQKGCKKERKERFLGRRRRRGRRRCKRNPTFHRESDYVRSMDVAF